MITRNHTTFDPAAHAAQLALEQSDTVISTYTVDASATARALYAKSFGVWYVEWVLFGEFYAGGGARVGVARIIGLLTQRLGYSADDVGYDMSGTIYKNNASVATAPTWGFGDVISMAVDLNARVVYFLKNGVEVASVALAASVAYVPAASLWQGTNEGTDAKLAMLLSAGQRRMEYLGSNSIFGGGLGDGSVLPNVGWFYLTAGIGMFRLADRAWMNAPTDSPANVPYDDALGAGGMVLTDELHFWVWGDQSGNGAARVTLKLHNADADYDDLLISDARDADVVLRLGDTSDALASMTPVAHLLVDSVQANDDGAMSVGLTDKSSRLQIALQQRLILPTADENVASKPWPWGVGTVRSAEPINIKAAERIYAVNDGPIAGVGAVRERGDPLDPSTADYVLNQIDGTMQLATEAQGRVTIDYSTLGGDLPVPPTDLLGGIGDFASGAGWTLDTNWFISAGALQYSFGLGGLLTSAATTSIDLVAGRVYKITVYVQRLSDHEWSASNPSDNMAYITAGGDDGNGNIDAYGTWGKVRPIDAAGFTPFGPISLIGVARVSGPLHIGIYTGVSGATAIIDDAIVWEVAQQQLDDESLIPATLEHALRALLEGRAGLRADEWSFADARAIDTATGYQGIGYFAPSAESPTVAEAMRDMLASYSADYYIDETNCLRFVRMIDPAGETATATIDSNVMFDDASVAIDLAPGLTTQMQGRKNWAPLDPSEMVTDDLGLPYYIDGGAV